MILTGPARIVQLHPTRHCNLSCSHCYSSSGPREREQLELDAVLQLIEDAAQEGYNVLNISGGEPLMYPHLRVALRRARDVGLVTTLVTNGSLLDDTHVSMLAESVDSVAVSLDGSAEVHDRMRGRQGAFAALEAGLGRLAAAGVRFAIIYTLSEDSVGSLLWAARFAARSGAAALQVHALDDVGRGVALGGQVPLSESLLATYLAVAHLREALPQLSIQLDTVERKRVAEAIDETPDRDRLANLVSPLVIEPSGDAIPLQYGFPRRFALGSIVSERLPVLRKRWVAGDGDAELRSACRRVLKEGDSEDLIDPYRELSRMSEPLAQFSK